MPEPSNIENREIESRLVDSKEWQAAIESIPQIVDSSRRLIELSSKNKGKLDERKWKSMPRNSDENWLGRDNFNARDREAMKGPNGETLEVSIWYPNKTSNEPDLLQVYGSNHDGYFGFTFKDKSKEQKTEEVRIAFDKDGWRVSISCLRGGDIQPKNLFLDYNTEFDGDRLFVDFEGIKLKFDEQGNIDLPKDKANIDLIIHFLYSSMLRERIVPEDREEIMDTVKRTDKMRKRELEKDPDFKQELIKRIGFLPPENYAQVQEERINSIPTKLNWFEGLNIVKARIQETIAAFESTFQA